MFQIVGTALLMLGILAVVDPSNLCPSRGLTPIAIGSVLAALGMAFGMNFGFAVNPARDFAPRVFVAVAGWGGAAFRYPIIVPCRVVYLFLQEPGHYWVPKVGMM